MTTSISSYHQPSPQPKLEVDVDLSRRMSSGGGGIATKVVQQLDSKTTSPFGSFWSSGQPMPPPATVAIPPARRQQLAHLKNIQASSNEIVPDYSEEKVTVL